MIDASILQNLLAADNLGVSYLEYDANVLDGKGDYVFKAISGVNDQNVLGLPLTTALAYMCDQETIAQWHATAAQAEAEIGKSVFFEMHMGVINTYYRATMFAPKAGSIAVIYREITEVRARQQATTAAIARSEQQRGAIADLLLHEAVSSGDTQAAAAAFAEICCKAAQTARASVWLISENGHEMRCLSLYDATKKEHSTGAVLRRSDFPRYFEALQKDTHIYATKAQTDERTAAFADGYLKPLGISALLDAGILINGQVRGVVCLEHIGEGEQGREWQVDEQAFASTVAAVFSQVLVNNERQKTESEMQRLRAEQEAAMLSLSTPITKLWHNILLLPLVGTMDNRRAQIILSSSLEKVAATQARVFILDISGVNMVDTAVANGFIRLAKAVRLMGCSCILSGISPAIAQTIVELGIQIDELETTSTMQDALVRALSLTGMQIAAAG